MRREVGWKEEGLARGEVLHLIPYTYVRKSE